MKVYTVAIVSLYKYNPDRTNNLGIMSKDFDVQLALYKINRF